MLQMAKALLILALLSFSASAAELPNGTSPATRMHVPLHDHSEELSAFLTETMALTVPEALKIHYTNAHHNPRRGSTEIPPQLQVTHIGLIL